MDKISIIKELEKILENQPNKSYNFQNDTKLDLVFCGDCSTTLLFNIFITPFPRRADENIMLVSRPIWCTDEVNDVDCIMSFSLMECKQILDKVKEQLHDSEYTKIYNMLLENDANFDEINQFDEHIEISVTLGDWKHSHMRLDCLMREIGYVPIDEKVTHSSECDCYSSIHKYIKRI